MLPGRGPQLFHTSLFNCLFIASPFAASSQPAAPMAHHHSGSSSRRRLSEMLGEQQEPFYLDLYLLEKGCSPAFLDTAACGGGGACSMCWPTRARNTGGRLMRRTPTRSGRKGRGGVLRLLLSKLLSGATPTAPVAAVGKKKRQKPAVAIDWRRSDEKQSSPPGCSTSAAIECRHQTEVDDEEEQREEEDGGEEEEDESSKKQLSPVSVLEQRLFEHSPASPPPPHAQKAFVLFSDLLEAAYAPTTLVHLLANARQQYSVNTSKKDGRRRRSSSSDGGGGSTPATRRRRSRNCNNKHVRRARREAEEDAAFERGLATATALVASELGGASWVRAEDVGPPEREDVAGEVAAAVLDALTEEAAAELMVVGMMILDQKGLCG
ncbi:unnamed protein product [Urochloa decumbens]|uniref:Uncharacterized protein n=1 Tax=Urochloa decumbens TaxID=240449 RepID=A0ABC8WCF0_9POAL